MAGPLVFSKINKEDDKALLGKEKQGISADLLAADSIAVSYPPGNAPLANIPDRVALSPRLSELAPIMRDPQAKKPSL